jgi:ferredoxin-NADP reductase
MSCPFGRAWRADERSGREADVFDTRSPGKHPNAMAERGATPTISPVRRKAMSAMRALFTPLLPDDYLDLINPLWSTQELRGRIERIDHETTNAATILIRPGWEWEGHEPGQYLRIGVVVDGVHHWRAYSLTSDPGRPDGFISITPKNYEPGVVSPYLVERARPGEIVRLGGVEGQFTLPEQIPEKLLFLSAGSGVTPIMSMLRCLARRDELDDVRHLHSAREKDEVIFASQLRRLEDRHAGYDLDVRLTGQDGRIAPADLDQLVPDWRERVTFACGPRELLDDLSEHFEAEGDADKLVIERFQPVIGGGESEGEGGCVRFAKSDTEVECDGATPILEAGEEAGLDLDYGCRMGICHTCTGRLCSGRLRDLRSGEVHGSEGEIVRICIAAPEGDVVLDL